MSLLSEKELEEMKEMVRREVEYFREGGTPYRKSVALWGSVAIRNLDVAGYYLDKDIIREQIGYLALKMEYEDQLEDVAKFVYTLARCVRFQNNVSKDLEEWVKSKMVDMKPLSFVEEEPPERVKPVIKEAQETSFKTTKITESSFDDMIEEYVDNQRKILRKIGRSQGL